MKPKTKISKPSVYGNEKYNIAISELKQRLSLIITALIGTAFGFICLGAYIVKSSQSQIIPYLVTVDTHGVILAKSIPAKKMGVRTGESIGEALRKCPGLIRMYS